MLSATNEPTTITAGDSLCWSVALTDFPAAAGWSLSYGLTGTATFTISTTVADPGYQVQVPATTTAGWQPGQYLLTAFVSRNAGTERQTLYHLPVQVLPDPAAAPGTTHASRMLALIEAALEGRIPLGLEETNIDGQMLSRIPLAQLSLLQVRYQAKVQAEQAAARAAAGVQPRRQILVRFRG